MQKPFEVADLVARLKGRGLDLADDLAVEVVKESLAWVKDSLAQHENVYLKFLAPLIQSVEPVILSEVDKLDGKVG